MEDERRTEYDTEAVRLTDLQDDKIGPRAFEDLTFTNCYIRGPAVIPIEGIQLNGKIGIDFGGDPDYALWTIPEGQRGSIGLLPLRRCVFNDCTFAGIGFAGYPSQIADLRSRIH